MLLVVRVSGGRMMGQQRQQQRELASLSDLIQEDLSGISAIKIYRQEPTEEAAFARLSNRYRDAALDLARTRSTLFPLLEGISSLSLLVLLGLGTSQLAPLHPQALKTVSQPGAIEARQLQVRYPDSSNDALKGVNFKVKPGELVAVVGPVGCGKTTLARALGRMVDVPGGQLLIDGQDITSVSLEDLRSKISLVPQEGYLFTATLAENLRFGRPNASDTELRQAARQAQLEADVQAFPNGYETLTMPWPALTTAQPQRFCSHSRSINSAACCLLAISCQPLQPATGSWSWSRDASFSRVTTETWCNKQALTEGFGSVNKPQLSSKQLEI